MKIDHVMVSLSLIGTENEYCLYVKVTDLYKIYIIIYVHDVLTAGTVGSLKRISSQHFEVNDMGIVNHFLGMIVNQNDSYVKISLNKTHYLK